MIATIFKNIFSKEPHYVSVMDLLKRIRNGISREKNDEIRGTLDKEKKNKLKLNLPSVCFSGKFKADRQDIDLIEHSGFLVLDFDDVADLRETQMEIISSKFVFACWVSPSGSGLKALIKIADGSKHREHFQALQEVFPSVDRSGINVSRVCYESYDPEIYINESSEVFKKIKTVKKELVKENANKDESDTFKKLLTWLTNRNDAFVSGERNNFIFKLASACCRYGIDQMTTENLIGHEFLSNSEFSTAECNRAIKSAYKSNSKNYGSASFEREVLVDRVTRKEIEVDDSQFESDDKTKDVVYGIDVKEKALGLYDKGYVQVAGIGVPEFDERFKPKRGEISLLTGIGNYGKSALKKWYHVFRAVMYGEKFGGFVPEDNPAEEYYHDLVEILLGCDCTPNNPYRPNRDIYDKAYDFICQHFFYVYPKMAEPTPKYIKEVFLELIVKEGIDGCDIDPFNQMSNNYQGFGGRDKYLEFVLTDLSRFAMINDVYLWVIAHPIKLPKAPDGNYVCPDVFDIADGAMWNNKTDNILVYHRPFAQSDPQNPTCEFHSKKIRRQKTVGKKGSILFEMNFSKRRFMFGGLDPLGALIEKTGFDFKPKQTKINFNTDIKDIDEIPDILF